MTILYILLVLLFLVILFRVTRFFSTPFLRRVGFYKYYSDLLFLMPFSLSGKVYDIHLGTSWDFFQQRDKEPVTQLIQLGLGLVKLCEDIEKGVYNMNTRFTGNTFYVRTTTLEKFGFHIRNLNPFELLLFAMNYIELTILTSIAHKKFTSVPLGHVVIIFQTAEELLQNKQKYIDFLNRMTKFRDTRIKEAS